MHWTFKNRNMLGLSCSCAMQMGRFEVRAILTFAEAQDDPAPLDPNGVVRLTQVESSGALRVVADRQLPGDTV